MSTLRTLYQLGGQHVQPINATVGKSSLYEKVLSLHVAEARQAFEERAKVRFRMLARVPANRMPSRNVRAACG
jgi:hypothetical protein